MMKEPTESGGLRADVAPVHEHIRGFRLEGAVPPGGIRYYTLLRTPQSKALHVDKRFQEHPLILSGRIFPGTTILEVSRHAGIAHACPLEDLEVADFQRVMDINVRGYMLFMREGVRILKRQGLGGHIVINASKNVFGPGKDFGAYSASKAAGHQLGKVAAIELAGDGIRVNMINADAVFSHNDIPSGLWAHVGPERAASRGMKPEDLPDYYRSRNLLKARVTGRHVGNAVVFFASNATPTTGATLPVDGGVVEAFPR